jgi:CheY-like chemotaxis protein
MRGNKSQARILVLDDNQMIALTLSALLQKQGYEVATAFSGEEAVAKAADFIPGLLLFDVSMESMNGLQSVARITANLPNCKVMFFPRPRLHTDSCPQARCA